MRHRPLQHFPSARTDSYHMYQSRSGKKRSTGYGYINFSAGKDAESYLGIMNYFKSSQTMGRTLQLMWITRDPSSHCHGSRMIFLKYLANTIDCKTLHDTCSQLGENMVVQDCDRRRWSFAPSWISALQMDHRRLTLYFDCECNAACRWKSSRQLLQALPRTRSG